MAAELDDGQTDQSAKGTWWMWAVLIGLIVVGVYAFIHHPVAR